MNVQLTDSQLAVLEPACRREDLCVYPITASLKGGAVGNVCKSLLKRGLLEETPATDRNTVFRHNEAGTPVTLRATEAGRRVASAGPSASLIAPASGQQEAPGLPQPKVSRQEMLLELLGQPGGATIAEMVTATGWQAHSVRGALSGVIGKRLGLKVTSEKMPDRERVYRVS